MNKHFSAALLAFVLCSAALAQDLTYPATKRSDQVDTYFGVQVADPYRWLEDDHSAETKQWVEEQNKAERTRRNAGSPTRSE